MRPRAQRCAGRRTIDTHTRQVRLRRSGYRVPAYAAVGNLGYISVSATHQMFRSEVQRTRNTPEVKYLNIEALHGIAPRHPMNVLMWVTPRCPHPGGRICGRRRGDARSTACNRQRTGPATSPSARRQLHRPSSVDELAETRGRRRPDPSARHRPLVQRHRRHRPATRSAWPACRRSSTSTRTGPRSGSPAVCGTASWRPACTAPAGRCRTSARCRTSRSPAPAPPAPTAPATPTATSPRRWPALELVDRRRRPRRRIDDPTRARSSGWAPSAW